MLEETVLSGIRATGRLHFGNYIGAVLQFQKLQRIGTRSMYFIADWHTLTTLRNPETLRGNVIEIVKDYLAAGLDPELSIIYAQSSVPEIAELSLYLSMYQPLGDLERVPTLKDLLRNRSESVTLGLVSYPVLMAADILGVQATLVPVGEDQVPNVELARNLAQRFNHQFGDTFALPEMLSEMVRVPGLDGDKMGKSDVNNAIDIDSPVAEIRERYLRRGASDPARRLRTDPGDPYTKCPAIYPLHEIVTNGEAKTREIAKLCQTAGIGCRDCKDRLVDSIVKVLEPFQERRRELADKDNYAKEVLHEGGKRARAQVRKTLALVRDKIGITVY